MGKYRKIPVEIEALQWLGTNYQAVKSFARDALSRDEITPAFLFIRTLEGTMRMTIGDYIIKGVAGEFYPCRKDIFEKTYEQVD